MSMMSPAASTSEPRKYTMLSPSVCAAGGCVTTTASPLKKFSFFSVPP